MNLILYLSNFLEFLLLLPLLQYLLFFLALFLQPQAGLFILVLNLQLLQLTYYLLLISIGVFEVGHQVVVVVF